MTTTGEDAAPPRARRSRGRGAGARSAPLGSTAGIPSTGHPALTAVEREEARRARRGEAIRWRSRLWSWSSLPRVRNCGRVSHTAVGGAVLRVSDIEGGRRAGIAGLQSCGSPWACPVCARRIGSQRSAEVHDVLSAVAANGGSAALVTLTMRHHRGHRLSDLWEALSASWGAVTSGRAWTAEQSRYGVLGWVRTVEATHGSAGWHLHTHALVVFDGPMSADMMAEVGGRMFRRWERALGRRGLSAVADRGGLDVRPVAMTADSLEQVSNYLAKITAEITAPTMKVARHGNRSPFAILRDALDTGLADDCNLWLTWEQASHGRRQLTWSRDLRAWAGLHVERTDEEIVATDDLHGTDLLVIPSESWPRVRAEVADLLDAVELGGLDAAVRWMSSRGLRWLLPRPRGEGVDPPGPSASPPPRPAANFLYKIGDRDA